MPAPIPVRRKGQPLRGDALKYWLCLRQFAETDKQCKKIVAVIETGSMNGAERKLRLSVGVVHRALKPVKKRAEPFLFPGMQYSEVDIVCFLKDHGPKQLSGEDFASLLGYTKGTINRAVRRLEDRGIVKVTRFSNVWGPEGCNKYELST